MTNSFVQIKPPSSPEKHSEGEKKWVRRFAVLKAYGYLLRPRYRPGWKAPWKPNDFFLYEEQSLVMKRSNCLDAIRISDGVQVFLKSVPKNSPEIAIEQYLMSEKLAHDPRNHCVPLLDVIAIPDEPDITILVFPLLRTINSPNVATIFEALEYVKQTLEGLLFLHEHNIAHRDCNWENVLMDGRLLFPNGWHPQSPGQYPDGQFLREAALPSRTAVGGVRYYFIDFGISTWGQRRSLGIYGQVRAPELSENIPYDPYLLDVFILGTGYERYLLELGPQLDFLRPLISHMTVTDPAQRPDVSAVIHKFDLIVKKIDENMLGNRLHPIQPQALHSRASKSNPPGLKNILWKLARGTMHMLSPSRSVHYA